MQTDPKPIASWLIPWRALLHPVSAFQSLKEQDQRLWGILAQAILLTAALYIGFKPLQMARESAGVAVPGGNVLRFLIVTIPVQALFTVFVLNAVLSALVALAQIATGTTVAIRKVFRLTTIALLPVFVGQLLSNIIMFFAIPTPSSEASLFRLQLYAYSFSPLPLLEGKVQSLSFVWFLLSYFDGFCLWALALAAVGMRHYLGMQISRVAAATAALVVIWILTLTLLWRAAQALWI